MKVLTGRIIHILLVAVLSAIWPPLLRPEPSPFPDSVRNPVSRETVQKAMDSLQMSLSTDFYYTEAPLSDTIPHIRLISPAESLADSLISIGKQYIGRRYKYGASGPERFDCTGFTGYVYRKLGFHLQRSARTQSTDGRPVRSIRELQKGDLVFFGARHNPSVIGHAGIVVEPQPEMGAFLFIHSGVTHGVEIQSSQMSYYRNRYICARRILPDFGKTTESE